MLLIIKTHCTSKHTLNKIIFQREPELKPWIEFLNVKEVAFYWNKNSFKYYSKVKTENPYLHVRMFFPSHYPSRYARGTMICVAMLLIIIDIVSNLTWVLKLKFMFRQNSSRFCYDCCWGAIDIKTVNGHLVKTIFSFLIKTSIKSYWLRCKMHNKAIVFSLFIFNYVTHLWMNYCGRWEQAAVKIWMKTAGKSNFMRNKLNLISN